VRSVPSGPNKQLNNLVKTVDSIMRREYGFRPVIKAEVETKWVRKVIEEETRRLLEEKKAAEEKKAEEEKKVSINLSQLKRIRRDAAATQEKLIVEEETEELDEPAPREPEPARPALQERDGGGDLPLNPAESRLLRCLLYGGDIGWVQAEGCILSVLVDGINEKLYDVFQDCVLNDTPQPIEDYADDLKEMVHP